MTAQAIAKQRYLKLLSSFPFKSENVIRYSIVIVLVLFSGFVIWFNRVYADPTQVFWGMVANNLSTPGVTREIIQKSDIVQTDSLTRLWFGPQPVVRNLRKISDSSSGVPAKITLESIANSKDVYQRYSFIDQPGSLGQKKPDFSSLYQLWLKNGGTGSNNGQVFNSSLFGFLFFGNFEPAQKTALVNYLKSNNVYKVDYQHVMRSSSGRRTYTYSVQLNTQKYIGAARFYVKSLSLPKSNWVESGALASSLSTNAQVSVDVLSREPTKIVYQDKATPETFRAFGLNSLVFLPTHTVSLSYYQNALNSINQ